MQEAHRARQLNFARPHADHLAAHAAQVRQIGARREAAAVDDDPSSAWAVTRGEARAVLAEAQVDAAPAKRLA